MNAPTSDRRPLTSAAALPVLSKRLPVSAAEALRQAVVRIGPGQCAVTSLTRQAAHCAVARLGVKIATRKGNGVLEVWRNAKWSDGEQPPQT